MGKTKNGNKRNRVEDTVPHFLDDDELLNQRAGDSSSSSAGAGDGKKRATLVLESNGQREVLRVKLSKIEKEKVESLTTAGDVSKMGEPMPREAQGVESRPHERDAASSAHFDEMLQLKKLGAETPLEDREMTRTSGEVASEAELIQFQFDLAYRAMAMENVPDFQQHAEAANAAFHEFHAASKLLEKNREVRAERMKDRAQEALAVLLGENENANSVTSTGAGCALSLGDRNALGLGPRENLFPQPMVLNAVADEQEARVAYEDDAAVQFQATWCSTEAERAAEETEKKAVVQACEKMKGAEAKVQYYERVDALKRAQKFPKDACYGFGQEIMICPSLTAGEAHAAIMDALNGRELIGRIFVPNEKSFMLGVQNANQFVFITTMINLCGKWTGGKCAGRDWYKGLFPPCGLKNVYFGPHVVSFYCNVTAMSDIFDPETGEMKKQQLVNKSPYCTFRVGSDSRLLNKGHAMEAFECKDVVLFERIGKSLLRQDEDPLAAEYVINMAHKVHHGSVPTVSDLRFFREYFYRYQNTCSRLTALGRLLDGQKVNLVAFEDGYLKTREQVDRLIEERKKRPAETFQFRLVRTGEEATPVSDDTVEVNSDSASFEQVQETQMSQM